VKLLALFLSSRYGDGVFVLCLRTGYIEKEETLSLSARKSYNSAVRVARSLSYLSPGFIISFFRTFVVYTDKSLIKKGENQEV
jgi:hypothetical protein